MRLAFDHPWLLLLLAGCLPTLLGHGARWLGYASLAAAPLDPVSAALDGLLRLCAAVPIAAIVLGLAGLHQRQQIVEHTGSGAHIVVALDRSLSMDEPFALRGEKARETKTQAAARMVDAFFARRPHDSFGLVGFSTNPIVMMPLTDHRAAAAAAIAAMGQKALANTDIGAGMAMGLQQFAQDPPGAARVLVLMSDGAGDIPPHTRDVLRAAIERMGAHLYYLYLRSGDEPPLAETLAEPADLSRPSGLDGFFRTLGTDYAGFEVRDAGAIDAATRRIGALETHPIAWRETLPRHDLDGWCDLVALAALAVSVLAQAAERRLLPAGGIAA